jgi:SAM-dependent methyltransferase
MAEENVDIDFGRAATDYARYRAGFPDRFFDQLFTADWVKIGNRVLDLGTGTGPLARGLAKRGCHVVGLDRSQSMLDEAIRLDRQAGLEVDYVCATAEATGLRSSSFDVITAAVCWHWFDRNKAAAEACRLLMAGGRLIIADFAWLPLPGSVVEATEHLIHTHNPIIDDAALRPFGLSGTIVTGIHPLWFEDLSKAEFGDIESFSFDVLVPYSHEAWVGRMRASAYIGASLPADAVQAFSTALRALLARDFGEDPLEVPHRVFAVTGRVPNSN